MDKYSFELNTGPKFVRGGRVLTVSGMVAETGTFNPSDGSEVTFTKDSIVKMFSNIDTNLPLWMNHVGASCGRKAFGFALTFTLTNDDTRIEYTGRVFEDVDEKEIKATSNESLLMLDDNGIVIDGKFTGIAFVHNPAMENATVTVSEEFSETGFQHNMTTATDIDFANSTITIAGYDGSNTTLEVNMENGMTEEVIETLPSGMTVDQEKQVQSLLNAKFGEDMDNKNAELSAKVDELTTENLAFSAVIEAQKEELAVQNEFITEVKGKEFAGIVNKLKEFGVADPETIVDGLEVDKQIGVLSKMFEKMAVKESEPKVKESEPEVKDFSAMSDEEAAKAVGLGSWYDTNIKGAK